MGNDRTTNPNYYSFRKMWHQLYFFAKPGKWHWLLVILARKFGIALAALAFRQTPAYQLAVALLIMFAAYVAQTRN